MDGKFLNQADFLKFMEKIRNTYEAYDIEGSLNIINDGFQELEFRLKFFSKPIIFLIRLFSPSKEVSELPIFEFKTGSFKFESSFKDSLTTVCLKKLKSLVTDPDWLPKFLKHFIKTLAERSADDLLILDSYEEEKDFPRSKTAKVNISPVTGKYIEMPPLRDKYMVYPPSGSFCWSPLGHLAIIHNPRLDIVRNVPEESLGKKKIMDRSDLESYFRSLRRNFKNEDYHAIKETKEFFLNDSQEDKDFHIQFENETLSYVEEEGDGELDFLNFNLVDGLDRAEKDDKGNAVVGENEISLKALRNKMEDYESFDLRQKPELKTKFLKLFKKNMPVRKKMNQEEKINRFAIYDFSSYCLLAESVFNDLIEKYQIKSFLSFQNDKLFKDMVHTVVKDNKNLEDIYNEIFEAKKSGIRYNISVSRYAFDNRYKLLALYLKNHFQMFMKQKNKFSLPVYLKSLFTAFYIENFINFTKMKSKTLEMVNHFLKYYGDIFSKNEYYELLFDNSHINSYNLFNIVYEEFVILLKNLNDNPEKLQGGNRIRLYKRNVCENSKNLWSVNSLDRYRENVRRGVSFGDRKKNDNNMPGKKWTSYNISHISQIQKFEIFDQDDINWLTRQLNEASVNFRKRGLFDQARIIEKILSLHYFIRKYIDNTNKLIDSYNFLVENKTQESYLKTLDTPIIINKTKAQLSGNIRSQHLQCYVCELRISGLALVCMKCKHGGHFEHVSNWIEKNKFCPKCPNPCNCFSFKK